MGSWQIYTSTLTFQSIADNFFNVTSQTRDKVKLDYCMNSSAFTHIVHAY